MNDNNLNNQPVINNDNNQNNQPVNTTPVVDKFMTVSDISQINTPQSPGVEPQVVQPQIQPQPVQPQIQQVNQQPVQQPQMNQTNNTNQQKPYTPPSKFKVAVLILFFILLVAFIMFLPEISSMVRIYLSGGSTYQPDNNTITTGRLICTLDTNTADLDKRYELVFNFTESKLKSTKFIVTTEGDSTTEASLDELAESCKLLKTETSDIEGVNVKCDYTDSKLVETQSYSLETLDNEKLSAAFAEAGGTLPSYQFNQEIDGIEKNMKASGYTCERE